MIQESINNLIFSAGINARLLPSYQRRMEAQDILGKARSAQAGIADLQRARSDESKSFSETEYMCLYTADGYEGELIPCDEGVLEWVDKKELFSLHLWEGDKIFFRLLEEERPFFSLKLTYVDDDLKEAVLDGKLLEL